MKKASLHKALSITISAVINLLPFVPYWRIIAPSNNSKEDIWQNCYLFNDIFLIITYIPIAALWPTYLRSKQHKAKKTVRILLAIFAFVLLYFSYGLMIAAGPDFEPSFGIYISVMVFPLVQCFVLSERLLLKEKMKLLTNQSTLLPKIEA